ncbi:MAG: hypothetical protein E7032_00555 [Akkermansiaceae bacterium]|nr:hypothetical protein [Akkermansiaceae bacterium]
MASNESKLCALALATFRTNPLTRAKVICFHMPVLTPPPGVSCEKQAESSSNAHPGIPKKLTK